MSKLTHYDLIELGELLGYSSMSGGLCHGFSCMLMQAIIAQEEERFWRRLKLIEMYKVNFSSLIRKIDKIKLKIIEKKEPISDQDMEYLEILAFYEGIDLYLDPTNHEDLFNQFVPQEKINKVYALISSVKLEDKNFKIFLQKSHAFNHDGLINYINELEPIVSNYPDLPVLINNCKHSVLLKYNSENPEKPWEYTDTEDFERHPMLTNYHRELNADELVHSLFTSLSKDSEYIILDTALVAHDTHSVKDNNLLEKLNNQYDITPEQATMYDKWGAGLLHLSSNFGHTETIKRLLTQAGIDLNKATEDGSTPLWIACQSGHLEVINLLVTQADIDLNKAKSSGSTPLYIACQNGHIEVVKLLLAQESIDINKANLRGGTSLFIACQQNRIEVIKLLLAQKTIDINKATENGCTPLHLACSEGNIEVIKLLLEQDAIDINKAKNNECTPFTEACDKGNTQVVSLLLQTNKVEVNKYVQKQTSLHIACYSSKTHDKHELFRLLLNNKADLYLKNDKGHTALDIAFLQKNKAAIEELLFYAQKNNLSLASLMSADTHEKARRSAVSVFDCGFFGSTHQLELKKFILLGCTGPQAPGLSNN